MSIRFLIATLNFSFNILNALLNRTRAQFWTPTHPTPPTRPSAVRQEDQFSPPCCLMTSPHRTRFNFSRAWPEGIPTGAENKGLLPGGGGCRHRGKAERPRFSTTNRLGRNFFPTPEQRHFIPVKRLLLIFARPSPFCCFHLRAKAISVSFF